jgi:hypothetical protein
MVFQLLGLALKIALSGHDILLIRVVHFLVFIDATGSDCNPLRAPLWPISTTLGAFADDFGRCCSAAAGDCFPIAEIKEGPDHLLARDMLGGDIKQLLGGVQQIMTKFMD